VSHVDRSHQLSGVAGAPAARAPRVARRAGRRGLTGIVVAASLAVLADARTAGAQGGALMGPFERARALVETGRGEAGRALVDSVYAAAVAGTPAHAEALWWRAVLAAGMETAETDLRRIVAEYPWSPRAAGAAARMRILAEARAGDALAMSARPGGEARSGDTRPTGSEGAAGTGAGTGAPPRVPDTTTPARSPHPSDAVPPRSTPAPSPSTPGYTVQVAAYAERGGAESLARRLAARGHPARVAAQGPAGDRPPFRVRIGRFATRSEAAAALRALAAQDLQGFVTAAEPAGAAEPAPPAR
jgi:cell division septation protein DedD